MHEKSYIVSHCFEVKVTGCDWDNFRIPEETQSVVYSTGCYLIREVSCEFCENKLGNSCEGLSGGWN